MLKNTRKARVRGPQSLRPATAWANGSRTAFAAHRPSLRPCEDIQSAQLWLADGAPLGDVLTMLEAKHRFELSLADCRVYAVEILWKAQALSRPKAGFIPTPKESHYAVT